jgi:hypothetical protein
MGLPHPLGRVGGGKRVTKDPKGEKPKGKIQGLVVFMFGVKGAKRVFPLYSLTNVYGPR